MTFILINITIIILWNSIDSVIRIHELRCDEMIKSMTGYGRAQGCIDGKDITIEMKSVNHRYFEFSSRISRGYSFLDEKLKSFVQSKVSRGKVDMFVQIQTVDETAADVMVNHSLAAGYYNAYEELIEKYDLSGEITLGLLARNSDIFTVRKAPEDEDKIWTCVEQILSEAVDKFIDSRIREGEKLKEDISSRAENILNLVSVIEERSPQIVEQYMSKLRTKIEELIGDTKVDEQRIITEVAIFGDKVAVAEETVRLRSHFEQFEKMLASNEAVGRKLDFIVQEMNREANTIGSKSQDANTAHIVVEIKSEIEKIREQVQNIE